MCNCKNPHPQFNPYQWVLEGAESGYAECPDCETTTPARFDEYSLSRKGQEKLWMHKWTCEHCGRQTGNSGRMPAVSDT